MPPILRWLYRPPLFPLSPSVADICLSVQAHCVEQSLSHLTLHFLPRSPSVDVGEFSSLNSPQVPNFHKNQKLRCPTPTPNILKLVLDQLSATYGIHINNE